MLYKTMPIQGKAPVTAAEALTTDQVRQGETGHGLRYVLAVSLAAALIALAAAWMYVT